MLPACHPFVIKPGRSSFMARALMWIVIVIFVIGLLVVFGIFDLIF